MKAIKTIEYLEAKSLVAWLTSSDVYNKDVQGSSLHPQLLM